MFIYTLTEQKGWILSVFPHAGSVNTAAVSVFNLQTLQPILMERIFFTVVIHA